MTSRVLVASVVLIGVCSIVAAIAVGVDGSGDASPSSEPTGSTPETPSTSPRQDAAASGRWLLPDVRSLPPRQLEIQGSGDDRRLRFASWLANDGPGPLLLRPRDGAGCPLRQRSADQVLHVDTAGDGSFQRDRDPRGRTFPVGCMVDHPTHDHWHFDAMARYALTTIDGSELLAERDKVSFCLRDNTPVPGSAPAQRKEYFGECGRDIVQGISPGWVDVYDTDTPGQELRLPSGLPAGRYCLTQEADPAGLLRETDEADNAVAIVVRIAASNVRALAGETCA